MSAEAHTLLGGWRLAEPYAGGHLNGGGLAVDWASRTLFAYVNNPNEGRVGAAVFDLPQHGGGADPSAWPVLRPRAFIRAWWDHDNPLSQGPFCQGLLWSGGKLWAVCRDFYPVAPALTTVVKATDGERRVHPLGRQAFGNFAKRYGADYWLACGGHETGQGTMDGPTLAKPDGTVLLSYSSLIDTPGPNNEFWDTVAPRFPDHWPIHPAFQPPNDRVDYWLAWNPRDVGRGLEGRWASDHVESGALVFADGRYLCWPLWGIGALDYRHQNTSGSPVFAASWDLHRTAVYEYKPRPDGTYELVDFDYWPDGVGGQLKNPIRGSDFGPTSDTYLLLEGNAWHDNQPWAVNAQVRLYQRETAPPPPPPPQSAYYLSAEGDDTNDGRTPATPWRTLTALGEILQPGDTVLLRAGDTFEGSLELYHANLTFASYGAGRATWKVTDPARPALVVVSAGSLTVRNLNVVGPGAAVSRNHGIDFGSVGAARNVLIENVGITGFARGINVTGNLDGGVTGVTLRRVTSSENLMGAFIGYGDELRGGRPLYTVFDLIVERCLFDRNGWSLDPESFGGFGLQTMNVNGGRFFGNVAAENGIQMAGQGCAGFMLAGANLTVEGNETYRTYKDARGQDGQGIVLRCTDSICRRNYVHHNAGVGILVDCVNLTVAANTVAQNWFGISVKGSPGDTGHSLWIKVLHNTVYQSGEGREDCLTADGAIAHCLWANNLLVKHGAMRHVDVRDGLPGGFFGNAYGGDPAHCKNGEMEYHGLSAWRETGWEYSSWEQVWQELGWEGDPHLADPESADAVADPDRLADTLRGWYAPSVEIPALELERLGLPPMDGNSIVGVF